MKGFNRFFLVWTACIFFIPFLLGLGFPVPEERNNPESYKPLQIKRQGSLEKECKRRHRHGVRRGKRCSQAPSAWHLDFTVSIPDPASDTGFSSNAIRIGQDPGATDLFDPAFDLVPFLAGPIEAYSDHTLNPDYDVNFNKLWFDFRDLNLPKAWIVVVKTRAGEPVNLTWALPSGEVSCATQSFILEDVDGLMAFIDLCVSDRFGYTGDGTIKRFNLIASLRT